ncbi:MAG: hypothetical protein KAJ16_03300 [Calditrichia bacterium]|nr:hypothetical protein [Calditrichia bacterium]
MGKAGGRFSPSDFDCLANRNFGIYLTISHTGRFNNSQIGLGIQALMYCQVA